MNKKIMALLCSLLVVSCLLSACGMDGLLGQFGAGMDAPTEGQIPQQTQPEVPESEETEPQETQAETNESAAEDWGNGITKLFSTSKSFMYMGGIGMTYSDDDTHKSGVVSVDGKHDTGAIYHDIEANHGYFKVTLDWPETPEDIDKVNTTGLIDGEGNEIIPAEYAVISPCTNDRYFKVVKATGITENKDEALLYLTSNMFSLTASEGDTLYKGVWYIFDTQTGKTVEGASATNAYSAGVTGDLVSYINDNDESVKINTKGEAFPEGAKVFDNGSYYMPGDQAVYDAFGQKLFEYNSNLYGDISYDSEGYYRCTKYADGKYAYVIMDLKGQVVSKVFESYPYIYGENLVIADDVAYDFQGNGLVDKEISTASENEGIWYLQNYDTDEFFILNEDFELLFYGTETDDLYYSSSSMYLRKKQGDKTLYYSFAQKDFIYEGTSLAYGYIQVANDAGTKDLVNAFTGETVMTGFTSYSVDMVEDELYIFAGNYSGGWNVFVKR